MKERAAMLRSLPSVDRVITSPAIKELAAAYSRQHLVEGCRRVIERMRREILAGQLDLDSEAEAMDWLMPRMSLELEAEAAFSLRPVINATGVVLHTNLGRAVLGTTARERLSLIAAGYSNLELDLETGGRGLRHAHVARLLATLTGAEAALAVNNNAAAVLLALSALAAGREVVVSRGELVEIGGAFRIPEVMVQGGARLVEVGATNRTYLADYERAIGPDTALLLKVHPSNYRVQGFTHQPSLIELAGLARRTGIPLMEDLGSGFLWPEEGPPPLPEPQITASLAAGVDVVTFSGDKLLGGPQAGIIAGRRDLVQAMENHPLARALRIDKLSLAALEGTLWDYLFNPEFLSAMPILAMLTLSAQEIETRAQKLLARLEPELAGRAELAVVAGESEAGGGSLPLAVFPTFLLSLEPRSMTSGQLAQALRQGNPAVMGRIQDGRMVFDLRSVQPSEDPTLAAALIRALSQDSRRGPE